MAGDAHDAEINEAAVDRLVERVIAAMPDARVRSAFTGTRGLAPTMVAVVSAVPATLVVIVSLVLGQPVLLLLAVAAMAVTMVVIMTRINATRVVAELPDELVVLAAKRGDLTPLARLPKGLPILPGGGRAWVRVGVGDEELWVSRPAFGGIVARLALPAPASDPPAGR